MAASRDRWSETKLHGKGRTKLRQAQADRGEEPPKRIARAAHSDSLHGEEEGDPAPRFSSMMVGSWLQKLQLSTAKRELQALEKFHHGQPVALVDTPLVSRLVCSWTLKYLACLSNKSKTWIVQSSSGKLNRFLDGDDGKNIYGNIYHVREPETRKLTMHLCDFAECFKSWAAERVYLSAELLDGQSIQADSNAAEKSGCPNDKMHNSSVVALDALQLDLKNGVDWDWLTNLRKRCCLGEFVTSSFQVLGKDSLLPLQYSTSDRVMAQVRGRQRLLLVSPAHAMHGLYPFPVHHMYDTYSMLDTEDVDTDIWPNASQVKGMQCILQPGECVFIPQFWSVAAHGLEEENITVDFTFGPRVCPREAAELQVSRVVEARVVELEGLDDAKHWLGVIARGEELQWIDLSSLRGFRRIQMVQDIRDHISDNCGKGACEGFLTAMCEGRLNPTTWLNKNFREPLYLLDKPVWHQDDRTEEEKRYPELFRKKLEGRGWNVQRATSTLRIPGYNS